MDIVGCGSGVFIIGLMVVEIGFSVRAGMATLPCAGCGPELYKLVGSFFFA